MAVGDVGPADQIDGTEDLSRAHQGRTGPTRKAAGIQRLLQDGYAVSQITVQLSCSPSLVRRIQADLRRLAGDVNASRES